MQNSELFRRGFVVPLTSDAELSLRDGSVSEKTMVDFFEIPSQEVFDLLWAHGLFERISSVTKTMLDDYEEDIVENNFIPAMQKILYDFKDNATLNLLELKTVDELLRLSYVAIAHKTYIIFVL